jgi:hypothetical protein
MAQIFDLASQTDWTGLDEGEVRVIPLLQYDNGVREHRMRAGEAILLAPGEPHGARAENGAVSINVDFA